MSPPVRSASLLDHFSALSDPRQRWRVVYPLPEILLLVLCATLSGMEDFVEIRLWGEERLDFPRRFLPYERGLPAHDTLNDVISALDAELFRNCFATWVESLRDGDPKVIAIDGKTSRRSHARAKGRRSCGERVGASPVTPQTTKPSLPCSICQATRSANAFSAMSSFSKGVASAVSDPGKIRVLSDVGISLMSAADQGEPLGAERGDRSDRGLDGAIDGGVCNELPPKPNRFIRTTHGLRPLARLESRVVQSSLPTDENPSSAAAALQSNPMASFILPNDELQTLSVVLRVTRFADIRGNGHFHACGDAIRSVDRVEDLPPKGVRPRCGKSLAT
jgi:DDE_Tnp_1-associated